MSRIFSLLPPSRVRGHKSVAANRHLLSLESWATFLGSEETVSHRSAGKRKPMDNSHIRDCARSKRGVRDGLAGDKKPSIPTPARAASRLLRSRSGPPHESVQVGKSAASRG